MADYTELEWSIGLQDPAESGDVYEFRVYADATPLDTYAVTPQLTAVGDLVVDVPTAVVHLTGRAPTAAGSGTATAAIPTALIRLTGRPAAIDEQEIAVPTAVVHLTARAPTASGSGTASTTIPSALVRLTAMTVTAAVDSVEPIVVDVPTAILHLQGQVPPESQSIDIPTAVLYLTALEVFARLLAARVASWQTSLTAPTFVVTLEGPQGDA